MVAGTMIHPLRQLDPLESIRIVQSSPGFLVFARVLGMRIQKGKSHDAFLMLRELSASAAVAHEIIEGWTLDEEGQTYPGVFTPEEEAACRFAFFVDDLRSYDWPAILRRALQAPSPKKAGSPS